MVYINLGQHSKNFVEIKVYENEEQTATIFYFSKDGKIEDYVFGRLPETLEKEKATSVAIKLMEE